MSFSGGGFRAAPRSPACSSLPEVRAPQAAAVVEPPTEITDGGGRAQYVATR